MAKQLHPGRPRSIPEKGSIFARNSQTNMNTYIVLLRGVMPTGKNRVPMAQLREVLSGAGFADVRTYIQSGNVVLRTGLPAEEVEKSVYELIKTQIGPGLAILARTGGQLEAILRANPFTDVDISRVFYTMFAQKPPIHKVQELLSRDFSPEQLVVAEEAAYMYVPGNAARSVLSNNFLEKKLGVSATTRNDNTMRRLIEMSRE